MSQIPLLRTIHYYFSRTIESVVGLPRNLLEAVVNRHITLGECHGIRIVDLTLENPDYFIQQTQLCLDLIRVTSPRRFRRIRTRIKYIVNDPGGTAGNYSHFSRIIGIDFARISNDYTAPGQSRVYAMLLVHEATHAYLEDLKFAYTRSSRSRIERICVNEANRLLNKFGEEWTHLRQEFNEADWEYSWRASWWRKSKDNWRRVKVLVRSGKK